MASGHAWLWRRFAVASRSDPAVACDPRGRWGQVGDATNQGWRAEFDGDRVIHVYPLGDLTLHDRASDDCVCGVVRRFLYAPDGSEFRVLTHWALDGRDTVIH